MAAKKIIAVFLAGALVLSALLAVFGTERLGLSGKDNGDSDVSEDNYSGAYSATALTGDNSDGGSGDVRRVSVKPTPKYSDVSEESWYYAAVTALCERGILSGEGNFYPESECTRLQFVTLLYNLHVSEGGAEQSAGDTGFWDVPADSGGAAPVIWANLNGIAYGTSDGVFSPNNFLTREQCCAIIMRCARAENLSFALVNDAGLFTDAADVSEYAKSDVLACRLAGIISGYEDGSFKPDGSVTNAESAALIYKLAMVSESDFAADEIVNMSENAYRELFEELLPEKFGSPVPESEAVDISYFDNAVFIGDSVSLRLEMYCASTLALGNAQFLCSGSLSATNSLWEVSSASVHPSYKGVKMTVEDGVKASGASVVYIMLGMNDIALGMESGIENLSALCDRILEKSPDAVIIIQSVTPMMTTSSVWSKGLNNTRIDDYNEMLMELCGEREFYYLAVNEVFKDENGNLREDYCSDKTGMGIHFSPEAAAVWVDYLFTHVPEALK